MKLQTFVLLMAAILVCPVGGSCDENVLPGPQISPPVGTECSRRDVPQFSFSGNKHVSDVVLQNALLNNVPVPVRAAAEGENSNFKLWTGASWEVYAQTVQAQIQQAYWDFGYCNAKAFVQTPASDGLHLQIEEGPLYTWGSLRIEGVSDELATELSTILTTERIPDAPTIASLPPVFQNDGPAKSGSVPQQHLNKFVNESLVRLGYEFAESRVDLLRNDSNATVDLKLQVKSGLRTKFNEIRVTGLEAYTAEQVTELARVKPTGFATREICDRLESNLEATGRFLHARVWPGTPFGPEQDVSLNIHVREYDQISPGQKLSPEQQAVAKFAEYLSNWSDGDDDLVIEGTLSAKEILKHRSIGAWRIPAIVDQALRVAAPVQFKWVMSPDNGSIIRLGLKGSAGIILNHTFIMTESSYGVVDHTDGEHWIGPSTSDDSFPGTIVTFGLLGLADNAADQTTNVLATVAMNKHRSTALARFTVTPAALLHLMQSNSWNVDTETAVEENDAQRGTPSAQHSGFNGDLKIEPFNGRPVTVSLRMKAGSINITSAKDAVKLEEKKLFSALNSTKNKTTVGTSLSSLVQFAAVQLAKASKKNNRAVLAFGCKSLAAQDVADSLSAACQLAHRMSSFRAPSVEIISTTDHASGFWRAAQALLPNGSNLHRLLAARAASHETASWTPAKKQYIEMIRHYESGPVGYLVAAWLMSDIHDGLTTQLSLLGYKYSKEELFRNEIVSAMPDGSFLRYLVESALRQLKAMSKVELAALAADIEHIDRDYSEHNPMFKSGALPLLESIRSLPQLSNAETLANFAWAAGIEMPIKSMIARVMLGLGPADVKNYDDFSLAAELEDSKKETASEKSTSLKQRLTPISLELPTTNGSLFRSSKAIK